MAAETPIMIHDGGIHGVTGTGTGKRGERADVGVIWPEMGAKTVESRVFARDNWNYREQKSVLDRFRIAPAYHGVNRIRKHAPL